MADQKLLFELRKLNPGVSDKDLIGAVAEATNSDPSKVQQALSPSILQKDREVSAIDRLRLANPGVDDEDLIDNVAIETNRPVSQVRKALGISDTKETKGLGERLLGDASAVGQKAGDLLGLNKRMGSVFDTVPAEADYKDMSFSEQQAQVSRQDERNQRAAGIIKNRKPKVKTFDEMSRSERAAFMAAENEKNKGFFDTLGEVGADVLTPEGFDKVRGKLPDAIGAIKSGIFDTSEASDDFAARGVGVNIPDVVKNFAAGANEALSAALFMQENVLGGRVILKAMGLDDPNTYPSQVFKREAMKLDASMSEGAKASLRPIINNDGSLVDIEDRGGVVMKTLRSIPFMMTVMATGGPLAKVTEKALPAAVQAISPLAKAFIDKQLPGLARYISSTIPYASASAFIESGMAGADQVRRVMDAPERELLGNKDYLKARLAGASKEEARAAMAQAVAVDAAYQNAAAAFVGSMVTGGGAESMMARFAAGAKPKDILGAIRQQAAEAGETPLKFVAKAAGQGGVAEFAEEAFVSGQQRVIENDIERRYFGNRSIDPNEGIIGASLEGGLIGLTSGSALSGAFAAANTPEKADKATSAKLAEYAKANSVEEVIDIARRNLATSTTKENVDKFLNDRFEEQVLTQLESPELQEAAGRGEDITGKIWDSLGGENNMFGYTQDEFQQKLTDIAAKDPEAAVTDQPVTDQPVTDQPVTEQPVTDQPVTDQPVTDQPVTEQPVTDQPVTDQPVTEQPVTGQPVDEAATADTFDAKMDEATAEEGPTVTTADGTPVTAFDPPPTQDVVDATTVTPDALPFATRENVTPAQVEARRGIATSLLENLTKHAGGRLLATNISRDLVVRGSSALIGQRVQSPTDLAVVSQVLRDPRFETLRFFFVKDGAIVDHRTFSSRMPTSSSFLLSARQEGTAAAAESFKKDIAAAMSDAQADGYYVVHNHPQGSPEPSQGDLNLTTWLGQNVPGFVDHVVINSNEFARISIQNGKAVPEVVQMDFGATKLPPAGNHPLLGASLINADGDIDLGSIAKAATALKNNDDIFIAYGVNGNGEISTIVELPAAFLNLPAGRQQAYFRAFVSRSGISAVTVSAPTKLYGRLKRYMGDSISFMINHQTGESTQNLETHPNEQFNKGKPVKVVTEREPVQRSAIEAEKEKAKAPSRSRDDITKAKQEAKAKKEARLKEIEKAKAKSRANRKERREAKTKAEEESAREELQKAIAQRIAENEAKEAAKKKEIEKVKPKPVKSEVAKAKANAKANKDTANLEKLDLLMEDLGGRVIGSNLDNQRTHHLIGKQGDSRIDSDTIETLSLIYKDNMDDVGLLINDKDGKIVAFVRVPTSFLNKSTPLVNAAMKDIYKLTGGKSVSVALHPSGSTIPMKVDVVVNANTGEVVGAKAEPAAKTKPAAKSEPFTLENLGRNAVAAAMRSKTGIFGNNKMFISHVWRQMERDGTTMGLTFDQFKQQLVLALNKGFVDLSRADLAYAMDQTDVNESETRYLNSEFHFLRLGGTDPKFKHPFSVEQVTSLERAIAKLAAKATTEGEKKKGIKRVNTADMAKIFPHKKGSLAKLENVDVLVNDKPTTGAAVAWDGDNIVLNTNGKSKDEISQLLEDISKKILTERKEALARLRKTEIPTGAKAANLTPEQQAKNQIAKSKALIDFYLKVKPLADLQNVAPSMQHLIPLSKRIQASKVKTIPDLTKFQKERSNYQDYMLAWKMLQGSNIVDFTIDITTNVYQEENRGKALAANAIEDFHKELREGVIKYMKDNNLDPKVVADYAFYLHVPEANEQIQKLWNDPRALAAGVTDEEAEAGLKKIEANAGAKLAAIKEAGNQWRDVAKETDRMLVDSGRISKEKHAAMNAVYKLYVPLRGNQDDSRIGVRRKGHEKREDEFIFENIIQMREAAIIAIERNRLNGILANFIAKVRNDNIGTISRPTKVATIKKQTVYEVRSSGKDGQVLGIFEDRDDAALFMDRHDLITDGNAIIKPTKEERAVMMAKPKLAPNEVVYYDNGEAIRIQINNDSLKRGIIDGSEKLYEGTLIKISSESLRFLTKIYTSWNLEFSVVNAVRDLTGSPIYVLGEKGFFETLRILGNYPRALSTLMVKPNAKIVESFRTYGGNIGAAYLSDLDRVKTDLATEIKGGIKAAPRKGFGWLGKGLAHITGASENALRLAVMMEGIRKADALRTSGASQIEVETMLAEYAQFAKDIMNFNRRGFKGTNMNAGYIFFNPGMQGDQVVAHAIMRSKHKKQVWAALASGMMISMFASLAAMGAFEDDEEEQIKRMMEYKSLDAYSKHRNLTIGEYKIPLAYGFSVFHSLGVAMAEMAMGLDLPKTAIEFAESAWLNFIPVPAPFNVEGGELEITPSQSLPTLLGILVSPERNRDSFGRQIVPAKYDKSVPDSKTMTNAMKDSPYEALAMVMNKASGGDENRPGAIDVSPNTINFFARTFGGGTLSGMLNTYTVMSLYAQGAGSTIKTSDMTFVRKFKVPKDDVRKLRSRFFDVKDTMQKEISRFKRDVKDEKVTELADQLFSPEEMKEANRISKAAKALKEEAREINNDKSLTTLQRRIQTKELELQELQLYNDFLIDFQREYGNKF